MVETTHQLVMQLRSLTVNVEQNMQDLSYGMLQHEISVVQEMLQVSIQLLG